MLLIFSCDALEARPIISKRSYLSPMRSAFQIEDELQRRSQYLMNERWAVIEISQKFFWLGTGSPYDRRLAEPRGRRQTQQTYLERQQVAELTASYGISAQIVKYYS
jgi:hypothetical protein